MFGFTKPERELKDQLKRALAEVENSRKRYARDIDRQRDLERDIVNKRWLALVDNLERALLHKPDEADDWYEGLLSIHQQALDILATFDIKPIETEGQLFDAALHEAAATAPDPEQPDNMVIEEIETGYLRGRELLRPAKVIVVKNIELQKANEEEKDVS